MEITIRDVIGTAHSNAAEAVSRLERMLNSDTKPTIEQMIGVERSIGKAFSDMLLAEHMSDSHWTQTTYVSKWKR